MRTFIYSQLDFYVSYIATASKKFDDHTEFHRNLSRRYFNSFLGDSRDRPFTQADIDSQEIYLKKLLDDGYIIYRLGDYNLTVKGKLFYFGTPWWFKDKPYGYQLFKEKLATVWKIVSVIAAIANAMAIIYLTYRQAFPINR